MNLLFIIAAPFRIDCRGHLGNEIIQAPNLDQLAREGTSLGVFA